MPIQQPRTTNRIPQMWPATSSPLSDSSTISEREAVRIEPGVDVASVLCLSTSSSAPLSDPSLSSDSELPPEDTTCPADTGTLAKSSLNNPPFLVKAFTSLLGVARFGFRGIQRKISCATTSDALSSRLACSNSKYRCQTM